MGQWFFIFWEMKNAEAEMNPKFKFKSPFKKVFIRFEPFGRVAFWNSKKMLTGEIVSQNAVWYKKQSFLLSSNPREKFQKVHPKS
jgi:hypothetical protein